LIFGFKSKKSLCMNKMIIEIENELQKIINNKNINTSQLSIEELRDQISFIIIDVKNFDFDKTLFREEFVNIEPNEKKYYRYMLDLYYKYNINIITICSKCGSMGTNSRNCPQNVGCKNPCMKSHYKLFSI
jgi:hypothetical protein